MNKQNIVLKDYDQKIEFSLLIESLFRCEYDNLQNTKITNPEKGGLHELSVGGVGT